MYAKACDESSKVSPVQEITDKKHEVWSSIIARVGCIESAALVNAAAVAGKQELEKAYCQSTNLGGRERSIVQRSSVAWCLVG